MQDKSTQSGSPGVVTVVAGAPALPCYDEERAALVALNKELEALMSANLLSEFSIKLFDDTLAPRAPKGTRAIFQRRAAVPGDAVFTLTADGGCAVEVVSDARPPEGQVVAVLEALGGGWPRCAMPLTA